MVCPVTILLLACLANADNLNLRFREHSDYVYTKHAFGDVKYVKIDGVEVQQPPKGSHCVPPNDCYEMVRKNTYLIVSGPLRGKQAIITVQPRSAKNTPIAFMYKKVNSQYPELPAGVMPASGRELQKSERTLQIIIFGEKTGNIDYAGNFSTKGRNNDVLTVLGKTGVSNVDVVLFTGHVGKKERKMDIVFKNGHSYNIKIEPKKDITEPMAEMTFIDYAHAFKKQ